MTTKHISSIILVVCLTNALFATSTTTIPFRFVGKLIVIEASVDGRVGNFILDTGTSNLVLNAKYFDGTPSQKVFQGVNGVPAQMETTQADIEIGTQNWSKIYAEILPLEHIEQTKGFPIHGLIGGKLFRQYELMINFNAGEITLRQLDKNGEALDALAIGQPMETLDFRWKGMTPCITAYIGDERLNLTIDTGAEINLMDKKYLEKLESYLAGRNEKYLGGFGKASQKVVTGKLSQIQIGTNHCEPMNTMFTSMTELNIHVPGPTVDGIIGYEFLSQFCVAINFKKQEIHLWGQEGPVDLALIP